MSSIRSGLTGVRDPNSLPPLVYDGDAVRATRRPRASEGGAAVWKLAIKIALVLGAVLLFGRCAFGVADRPRALGLSTTTRGASLGEAERVVVVVLHGYGGDEDDLARVARETLQLGAPEKTSFVFAEGPYRAGLGRAWWVTTDPAEREDSAQRVAALVDKVIAKTGLPSERVYLAGFSQGATLALEVALRRQGTLGGVVAFSPCIQGPPWSALVTRSPVRVVFAHGKSARVCPVSGSENLAAQLTAAGHPASLVTFDGEHRVTQDGEAALVTLLKSDP